MAVPRAKQTAWAAHEKKLGVCTPNRAIAFRAQLVVPAAAHATGMQLVHSCHANAVHCQHSFVNPDILIVII